jgi:hypothetical protein
MGTPVSTAFVQLIVRPTDPDMATFWRKWDWQIVLATNTGHLAGQIDAGYARSEARAASKGLDALNHMIAMEAADLHARRQARIIAMRTLDSDENR